MPAVSHKFRGLLLAAMALPLLGLAPSKTANVDGAAAPKARAMVARPNVVIILADDLGYNDLSVTGNPFVRTPNIDSIANGGARFITGYSGDAVCSPSRAALLTGRNPQRFGFEFLVYGPNGFDDEADTRPGYEPMVLTPKLPKSPADGGIDPHEITIPALLKTAGYHTGIMGKWHLGSAPALRPNKMGFDEFYGFLGGASLYADANDPTVVKGREPWAPRDDLIWRSLKHIIVRNDGQPSPAPGYMTDVLTDGAVDFIGRNAATAKGGAGKPPFFLEVAYNAPHAPLQAPKRLYDKLSYIKDENTRVYYAQILSLDEGVGRILGKLKATGADKNTIVFMISDNGGAPLSRTRNRWSNLPYRGSKLTYFEGGFNTPYFVRWPAAIAPGTILNGPASSLDILPTLAAAAHVALPSDRAYDGVNILPELTGEDPDMLDHRPPLVWKKEHYYAVRDAGWMLQVSEYPKKTWLFDLSRDPTERFNLADEAPDQVARLKAIYASRLAQYKAPRWGPSSRGRQDIDVANDVAGLKGEYVYWPN